MSTTFSGGHALPKGKDAHRGMSLRDYMAGQALSGITADTSVKVANTADANSIAKMCYLIADAMIAERSRHGEDGTLKEYLDNQVGVE